MTRQTRRSTDTTIDNTTIDNTTITHDRHSRSTQTDRQTGQTTTGQTRGRPTCKTPPHMTPPATAQRVEQFSLCRIGSGELHMTPPTNRRGCGCHIIASHHRVASGETHPPPLAGGPHPGKGGRATGLAEEDEHARQRANT